jgi:hypothetical protein
MQPVAAAHASAPPLFFLEGEKAAFWFSWPRVELRRCYKRRALKFMQVPNRVVVIQTTPPEKIRNSPFPLREDFTG